MHRFIHHPNNKPFHTHEYANAASGLSMGATSPQSFQERSAIDNNRQAVGKYHESAVANNAKGRVLIYGPKRPITARRQYMSPMARRQQLGGVVREQSPLSQARPTFVEPPVRRYNPYE